MAIVNFYQAYNMSNTGLWLGSVANQSSALITVSDNTRQANYYGSFKFSNKGLLSGGSVKGYEQVINDAIDFTVSNVNLSASKVLKFHQKGDGIGLQTYALSGSDVINGSAYNDVLFGYKGNDVIAGNDGDDWLDGGKGKDKLSGGSGDDIYWVDSAGDVVTEYTDEGYDIVKTTVSYSLGVHVEGLLLTGSAKINAFGNDLDNHIAGNGSANTIKGGTGNDLIEGAAGNDKIYGGAGSDTLNGGIGADTFVWNLVDKGSEGAPYTDVIQDFSLASKDKLDLRDLLQGESKKDIAGLQNYIDIAFDGSNTEIHISSNGHFSNGVYSAGAEDAHITLLNTNLLGSLTEGQLVKNLIDNKFLITD